MKKLLPPPILILNFLFRKLLGLLLASPAKRRNALLAGEDVVLASKPVTLKTEVSLCAENVELSGCKALESGVYVSKMAFYLPVYFFVGRKIKDDFQVFSYTLDKQELLAQLQENLNAHKEEILPCDSLPEEKIEFNIWVKS